MFINTEKFPERLSKEETIKYCRLAKKGNVEAKNILKSHNLRLVAFRVIERFNNTNLEYEELINIGAVGLMKAVETYDIDKNASFATYASVCIDNEILMSFRGYKKNINNLSLDSYINNSDSYDNNASTFMDILTDEKDFVDDIVVNDTYNEVRESLNVLNDLERKIVELYYGFDCQPLKQTEIANLLNLDQAQVSRVLSLARKKIKIYIEYLDNNIKLSQNSRVLKSKVKTLK